VGIRSFALVGVLVAAAIGVSVVLLTTHGLNAIEYVFGIAFVVGLLAAAYRQWQLGAGR
jgi:hypothetical protein